VRWIENASRMSPGGRRVSASVGVAKYHNGENIEDFIARADQKMYSAKALSKKLEDTEDQENHTSEKEVNSKWR